jgi:2-methylcitrate dehydratase (2-methyl-trans-aconitate forming)
MYERVLEFDLSSVVRNMAGPSNPHRRLPTARSASAASTRHPKTEEGKA